MRLIAGQMNEKGSFKMRLNIVNDAIGTLCTFYHRTERSILRGKWDDRFFYQAYAYFMTEHAV